MSDQRLTTGALLRYLHGNTSEKAILQVIGIKIIDTKVDDSIQGIKRYRIMLSDGKSTFSSCMLGTQMNHLIDNKSLKDNSIVRIERIVLNTIDKQSGRVMLMVYELEVIQSDSERIGDPIALPLTDIINNSRQSNRSETTSSTPPITNVIHQGSKTLPILDNKKSTVDTNRTVSKGSNPIDKEHIIEINKLSPYINKWTIKARVSSKASIRNYENARGPGKLFNCDLVDQSGEIRATAFNLECDKIYPLLEVGKVYYIARASLKAANRQFNTLNHDFEMTFNHDTCIEACDVDKDDNIPQVQFNFIPISEVANRAPNTLCDIIAIVKSTSDMQTIVGKTSQKEFHKRDILLVDENASITATLWAQHAEEFNGSSNPVIAFKGIRIGDFNGRTLSCVNKTLIFQDSADISRTAELRKWFDQQGKTMDLPDLSKGSDMINRQVPFKTFSQMIIEGIGLHDKPDYVNIKALVTIIKKDSVVYMMCPGNGCGKKVIDENNGTYRCEKCSKSYTNFKWAYMLSAEFSDSTGSHWINIFHNEAEALLGITAEEFGSYRMSQNEKFIDNVIDHALNRERIFKLRAKLDQFNDERKVRFTCVAISDIDWVFNGRRLIEDIKQMEPIQN